MNLEQANRKKLLIKLSFRNFSVFVLLLDLLFLIAPCSFLCSNDALKGDRDCGKYVAPSRFDG